MDSILDRDLFFDLKFTGGVCNRRMAVTERRTMLEVVSVSIGHYKMLKNSQIIAIKVAILFLKPKCYHPAAPATQSGKYTLSYFQC